jgi:hypothetical protein
MKIVSAPCALPIDRLPGRVQPHLITASKLARSRDPRAAQNSLDRGLQVNLITRSITSSKFAQSWPPNANLQTRLIGASKSISKVTGLRPPSGSPNSLNYALQFCTIMASHCISPNSLNCGFQVHLQTASIAASKCISKFARSWPRSASPNSVDHTFQVHLYTRPITASQFS